MSSANLNYLKTIFESSFPDRWVRNKDIILAIGVSAASVTEMLQKLLKRKLVEAAINKKRVRLSPKGKQLIAPYMSTYRLCEIWLYKNLEIPIEQVPKQAWDISMQTDTLFHERLNKYLGFPSYSPFGGLIQLQDILEKNSILSLASAQIDEKIKLVGYLETPPNIDYFCESRIKLKDTIKIYCRNHQRTIVQLSSGELISIPLELESSIYVSL